MVALPEPASDIAIYGSRYSSSPPFAHSGCPASGRPLYPLHQGTPLALVEQVIPALLIFILVRSLPARLAFFSASESIFVYYLGRDLRPGSLWGSLVFLITSMNMNRNEQDLNFTIKWIYVGLIVDVAWSFVQFFEIYFVHHFGLLDKLQKTVMMAGLPPNGRISGLALDPPGWRRRYDLLSTLGFCRLVKNYNWSGRRFVGVVIWRPVLSFDLFIFSRRHPDCHCNNCLNSSRRGRDRIRQAWSWFVSPLRRKSLLSNRLLDVGLRIIVMLAVLAGLAGGIFICLGIIISPRYGRPTRATW